MIGCSTTAPPCLALRSGPTWMLMTALPRFLRNAPSMRLQNSCASSTADRRRMRARRSPVCLRRRRATWLGAWSTTVPLAGCMNSKPTDTGGEFRVGHSFVGGSGRRACFCDRSWPLGGQHDGQRQRPTEFAPASGHLMAAWMTSIPHLAGSLPPMSLRAKSFSAGAGARRRLGTPRADPAADPPLAASGHLAKRSLASCWRPGS